MQNLHSKIMKQFLDFSVIDLTQPLFENAPTWNGSCGFCLEVKKDYDQMFRVQQVKMHAGVGTHMDAPLHRFEGKGSIADIPVEELLSPACVIDVRPRAHGDYEISAEDIKIYEKNHGTIPKGALVIGFTGWCRFWNDSLKYRNPDEAGEMHFPAFSRHAAEILLSRDVSGIAIDTLSPDCLDQNYPVHKLILGADKYIIENVADCSKMPARGGYAIALPLKAKGATESPIRLVGLAC